MTTELVAADCPVCLSAGSVSYGRCQRCEAEFEEGSGAVNLPPAAPPSEIGGLEPAEVRPLRFSDVIEELREVGALVSGAGGVTEIEAACGRLQTLLHALRVQFLSDVVLVKPGAIRSAP